MKQKYIKISSTAQALTYLLVIAVFILGKGVFKSNYIVAGILLSTVGFSLSWFIKDKESKIRQMLINAGYVGVVFLGTYKILKSSFLVEDILFLALESTLIMQAITSFNSHSPRNLKCIQIFSLVAFMCFPIFADTSNLIYLTISVLYLFIWGLIIKIQMLSRNKTLSFSVWPSYLVYLLSVSLIFAATNILRRNIVLNVEPKRGYTLETKKFDTLDRLFNLQATLFEITVISVDESPKDRKEIMQNVTFLFQESPDISEFEKANVIVDYFLQEHGLDNIPWTYGVLGDDGLVDSLKRPGSGIEPWGHADGVSQKKKKKRNEPYNDGSNQSVSILKNFIELKTDFENKTVRDNILDKVISGDKTLKTRIKTLLGLNNIRRASTQKDMNLRIDVLNKNIKTLPLDTQTKEELRKMVNNLKQWKLYSIYNNLRNSLKDDLRNADKNEKVSDFIKKIEKAVTASEISELYKKMESIKDVLSKAYPARKDDFEKSLKAMLEAKTELNLTGDADRLGKKITGELIAQDMSKTLNSISPYSNNYYKELKKLVALNITGDNELKKNFDDLLDKMMASYSVQETALLMKELEDILDKVKRENISPSEIKKIKDNLDKLKEIKGKSFLSENILSLIEDLNAFKKMTEESKKRDDLEKVISSLEENYLKGGKPNKDVVKRLEDILNKAKLASVSSSAKKALKKAAPISPSWQIVVFPKRLVVTQGEKINVKVIGLYNNSIIKDLTGEVSWTFEDSSIALIDSQGIINTMSTGQTKAVAAYGANKSYSIKIIVLEPLGYEVMSLKEPLQ